MESGVLGIHHITAIAGDPQSNINFYTGVLGLRLVKVTINYDAPDTFHFYYGDGLGRPGSIITFFPWPGGLRGRHGTGQVTSTGFSVPTSSLDYWRGRLRDFKVDLEPAVSRFGRTSLAFRDPDGLNLELVGQETEPTSEAWADGPAPPEHAIRGFAGADLTEEGYERTANLFTATLGFQKEQEEGDRFRYTAGESRIGSTVDLICRPGAMYGSGGVGTVHHIAWRTRDDETQKAWRGRLVELGLNVSPIMDRQYFHSIYFREPGGILFEIATDPPGFTVDETVEELGKRLSLPSWLEPSRETIERALPKISLPPRG